MDNLTTFQCNNLLTGTRLAAELQASSPELRAFVVIDAYVQTQSRAKRPSKILNADHDTLRFFLRKYEVSRHALAMDEDISDENLVHAIYIFDIQSIDQLEQELAQHIQDFSRMEVSWKVDNPSPRAF
jgi:hypothetical protein